MPLLWNQRNSNKNNINSSLPRFYYTGPSGFYNFPSRAGVARRNPDLFIFCETCQISLITLTVVEYQLIRSAAANF